jgi:hypothetical protein
VFIQLYLGLFKILVIFWPLGLDLNTGFASGFGFGFNFGIGFGLGLVA